MITVNGFIWDDWNKNHIAKHGITINEIEEVCHGEHEARESYKKDSYLSVKLKETDNWQLFSLRKTGILRSTETDFIMLLQHLKWRCNYE